MTKASDNAFPSILITEGTEPSAPAAGKQRLYIDSTTHKLKRTDSSGTDVTVEGASGAITSSGLTMATARLLGRTTASTGAVEEITVGSGLSLSAGSLTATGGSGTTYGQTPPYPTSSSGNDDPMTATTNWTDVDAFDTKEILDSTVLHLNTTGASKDDRVRYTLGTTRAGAFDFRFYGVLFSASHWGADVDTYAELQFTTSGGTQIAMARILTRNTVAGAKIVRVGQSGVVTTNLEQTFSQGQAVNLRFVRDGSNNVTFAYSVGGTATVAMANVLRQSDNRKYTFAASGTIARVELSIHTPSGPTAGDHVCDLYVDHFQDAS